MELYVQPILRGYSEMWAENREWRRARDKLKELAQRANIHVSGHNPHKNDKRHTWGTELEHNLTSEFAVSMSTYWARMEPRYWQWATSYPGARSQRPEFWDEHDPVTGWGVGYPKEPLARQYDSRTQTWYEVEGPFLPLPSPSMSGVTEDIQQLIDSHKWQAKTLRRALDDWMYQHGINGAVMDLDELDSHVDYVNEIERGNPIMQLMVEGAAPKSAAGHGSFPDSGLTTRDDPDFLSLENFTFSRSWPGILTGAAVALFL